MFNDCGEDNFYYEKRQRDIWLEEIQGLLLHYYPSSSANDKKAKADAIETIFKTRSWTKVSSMNSEQIKLGYQAMKAMLEKNRDSDEGQETDSDKTDSDKEAA